MMRRKAFPGSGAEVEAKYLRAGKWLLGTIYGQRDAKEWCEKNGVPIRKAQGDGIGSAGGFLVPRELANAILDTREVYGAFRKRARLWPMSRDNVVIPRHIGTASSASFFGENAAATEITTTVDAIELTAKKLGTLIRLSSELDEDSLMDAVDIITNEIAWAFSVTEDDCAFNGDGTSKYGGMRGIGTIVLDGQHNAAKVTATNSTFATLTATEVGKLVGQVQAAAVPNAAWYVSQMCFAQTFCRLSIAAMEGRTVDGQPLAHYLGFPVVLCQKLSNSTGSIASNTVMAVFGDMYNGAVLGDRRGSISLARSADRYLDSDQIAILGTERFDAVIHDVGDNTNTGMLAALVAP